MWWQVVFFWNRTAVCVFDCGFVFHWKVLTLVSFPIVHMALIDCDCF